MLNRAAAIESGIIHQEDHQRNSRRLKGLYGAVARSQNDLILRHCIGPRLLDVGAGYGNLTSQMLGADFEVIGIEIDEEKIARAEEWFGVKLHFKELRDCSEQEACSTIVFREVMNHLDLTHACETAFRLTKKRCIVFQGTEIPILRAAKWLYGHREHDQKTPQQIASGLRAAGFEIISLSYSDFIAFPLSGGWWGQCWIPNQSWLHRKLLAIDQSIRRGLSRLGVAHWFAFRFLLIADKSS